MRLSESSIGALPTSVARPSYDRDQPVGIVHFGIGAFHRAHQAWYTDACLEAGERGWMISGVSLRSRGVADQLNPQDGLYTLTEQGADEATRVIGSVREVLVAGDDRRAIVDRIAAPDCRIVSFTVTEKGYCRAPDGSLDKAAAAQGFYPIVEEALAARMARGLPGLTLLSCDNLAGNGRTLGRLMREWLAGMPECAAWFGANCTTPDSMVDRIVPATTTAEIDALESRIGLRDEGAVFTEAFSQWVIEDAFAGPRPAWDRCGAQIVAEVAPYETAKLRMLNGAHSLLAYCGLRAGYMFVHEAIADPEIRRLVERLMRDEAAPTIAPAPGLDLAAYADQLIARFANPALAHRLAQIAMDGSQKLPQRWLATLASIAAQGGKAPAILTGIAAWLAHLRGDNEAACGPVDDPLAGALREAASGGNGDDAVLGIFGQGGLVPSPWQPTSADRAFIAGLLD